MIDARDLACDFGAFELGPLSLRADKGEYWAILGPSGAGKSLLLQTLAGICRPDSGALHLNGRDAIGDPPEARGIGLVFQQSALFPHMSVRANIGYGLRVRRRRLARQQRNERVQEIVDRLQLAPIVERPVATLSGGEAQKVAIARALAIQPKVLLLDEPLGPIDHNTRLELRKELERIHSAFGLTTVHVTHSREEARSLASHTAVMVHGRIVQAGPTEELFHSPKCTFVARFLGVEDAGQPPPCDDACRESPGLCHGSAVETR